MLPELFRYSLVIILANKINQHKIFVACVEHLQPNFRRDKRSHQLQRRTDLYNPATTTSKIIIKGDFMGNWLDLSSGHQAEYSLWTRNVPAPIPLPFSVSDHRSIFRILSAVDPSPNH